MAYLNLDSLRDAVIKHIQGDHELQSLTIINESVESHAKAIQVSYFKATTTCLCIHDFIPASIINNCPGPLFPKIHFNVTITSPAVTFLKRTSPTEVAQKICNTLHFQTIQSNTITFFIVLEEKEFWKSENYSTFNKFNTIELKFTAIPQDA